MKKITLIMAILFTSLSFSQVTIGTGNDGGTFESPPVTAYYGYSYGQSIYLASEINSTGDITSMDFQLITGADMSSADEMVDVWIGHTTKSSFESTTDWVDVSTLTQVLTNGTVTIAADVLTVTFSTPFTYNGTDNLIIAFDANEADYGGGSDRVSATDGPTANLSLVYRTDTPANNPDPLAPPTGVRFQSRGNVTFNGISALCAPAAATASIVEDCDNAQFSILVDVTDLGDSTNLEITNDAGVASTMVTETGEVTVGPFPIGTPVVLTLENENEDTCDVVLDSVLDFCPTAATTLDYYNLQWPAALTFAENEAADQLVFAQAYEAGLTDTTTGAAAGIEAWIGYSDTDTDPSGTGWTWEIAPFFSEEGGNNNDQFAVAMQDLGLTEGTYYYASRFTLNAGPYMYGGFEGAWDATTNPSGVLTVTARLAVPGDDCANPIVINTLPYNTTDDTVNYTNFFGNGDSVCNANYLSGNDVVYTYTPSADANINLGLTELTATWSAIHLLDGCPTDEATACVGFAGSAGSTDRGIEGVDVVGGTTYYIVISTFATPNSVGYTLDITENTCANATATYTVVSDCGTSGGFNIEVDITDMGTATAVTVTDDQGNDAQAATEATILTFGPYTNATDVVITIADDNDGTCEQSSEALTQLACPPVNDDIATAIAITIDEGFCDGSNTNSSNISATDSAELIGDCFSGTNAASDVWFTFTVPADIASVDVSTDFTGGTLTDTELAVYSGIPGNLVEIGCSQDDGTTILSNGSSYNSLITDLAVTVGETYYVQVDGYTTQTGTFCLDISTNQVLSTVNYESESAFTYYPNPVKNTLTLNAQNTIEQVAMYNMLGQEVLRVTPNAVDSDLDMSNLQTGTYFVKVTIANVTETIRVIKQ
ncbi:putative secreted protein (Por secretion system target) [Winogradskyella pacifica]|uniref:Putative secreted protein (Por secretion system target) n=1 Tax=Winogradskyella pacifica TaxID=664642 RepID=A0A3D9LPB9_9FLAO|nr:T9SS type A sorting domain-containing protein [Winogradskyella pacifica]REE08277.1 putative secreted protein (Por secretion system target) [Winogradskyella pacifica]